MNLLLPARAPFSLYSVVRSHGWIQLAPFQAEENSSDFRYVARLASGRVVELAVSEALGGVQVAVAEGLRPDELEQVARDATWMLDLDQDFSSFYNLASAEPKLARMVAHAQGRVLRSQTLFEDVLKTILTTNTLWAGTKRMTATLVSLYGDPLPEDPNRRAFPTPARLAGLDVETLRGQARLGYRSPFVLALGRAVASGELDLESLKHTSLPTPELRKKLLSIKGVGGYAAANLLMLLGRYDFIPIDSWAMKMVSQEWHSGAPVGPSEVEAAFASWGDWKGLAYWFWNWTNAG